MILKPKKNLNIASHEYLNNFIQELLEQYQSDSSCIENSLSDFFTEQNNKKKTITRNNSYNYDDDKNFIDHYGHEHIHPELFLVFLIKKISKQPTCMKNNIILSRMMNKLCDCSNLNENDKKSILSIAENPSKSKEIIKNVDLKYDNKRKNEIDQHKFSNYNDAVVAQFKSHSDEINFNNQIQKLMSIEQPINNKSVTKNNITKVNDSKPVENKPVENKPVENKPVENKPVENKPVENKPVENKPVENKPVENKSVENKTNQTTVGGSLVNMYKNFLEFFM